MKHARLSDIMNITCAEKDEISRKNDSLTKSN